MKKKQLYILNNRRPIDTIYTIDIAAEPFNYYAGTVFAALQFALYTNPKRIYLAGFDCKNGAHYFANQYQKIEYQKKYWYELKAYQEAFFENTEIVSVNPVGLKGLFKDIYTI